MYINKMVGNGEDGLFYNSHNSKNITFEANNVVLNELQQKSDFESTILHVEKDNKVKLQK